MTAIEPLLITIPEAASALALCERTVRKLIRRGELTQVSIGRSVRISTRSLEQFVAARESQNTETPAG